MRQQYMFLTLLSHCTLSSIRGDLVAIFLTSELKPLYLMKKKKVQCVWPKLNYRRPLREKWLRHERYYNHFDFQEFLNNILPLRCSMPNYERSQTRWTATQNAIDFRWAFRGHHWVKYTKFTRRFFREFYSCIELENKTIDCIMKATITVKPSAVAFALCFSPTQIAS